MKKIFTRLAVAVFLSLGLLGLSTTANAAPTTQIGGWVYSTHVDIAPGNVQSTKTYNINAVATGSKVGKTFVTTSITCRYFSDPGSGTWQDWVLIGEFTEAPVTPIASAEDAKQYCIDNAYKAPSVVAYDAA